MSNESDGQQTQAAERLQLVEAKINLDRAKEIGIAIGGLTARDMAQVFEFAKGMSLSGPMVPAFCRGQPWTCFGICLQAIEWRMSPFSVARMAYEVENSKTREKSVAYMSQLTHAVLESRLVLRERLRVRYEPEGEVTDETVCIVTGTFKNEDQPREWKSPKLGERRPKTQKKTNRQTGEDYETTPGSPLWQTKPLVQLFYDTSRDWARIYCPDVTMGIYGEDEMAEHGFERTSEPEPQGDGGLSQRLSESALRSFSFNPSFAADAIDGRQRTPDIKPQNPSASVNALSDADAGGRLAPATPDAPENLSTDHSGEAAQASGAGPATPIAESQEKPSTGSRRRPRPVRSEDGEERLV